MERKIRRRFWAALVLMCAFALWTAGVMHVDVQPIGPGGSWVGFAAVNGYIHRLTGVHMILYHITDWLGLLPVAIGLCFALLGLCQWIVRRHILRVDRDILALGVLYLAVIGAYVLFEMYPVNYRPVLIEGYLETSYPSSTTLLVMCVMPTALLEITWRVRRPGLRKCLLTAGWLFTVLMVTGRLVSGVHWLSDIVGGTLVSGALVLCYDGACRMLLRK